VPHRWSNGRHDDGGATVEEPLGNGYADASGAAGHQGAATSKLFG